jgi:hypothetical protein
MLILHIISTQFSLKAERTTHTSLNETTVIKYSVIAKSFLKYYWHQICKYKIRQNYNLNKLPLIVQIIQRIFETDYIPVHLNP